MVAVAFAIRGDVHELGPIAVVSKGAEQAVGEIFAAGEQPFESDGTRDRAVVEK